MPVRQVIEINDELCTGCGLCVTACHEGAIALVDGKARLMRDDFCDGLGDCLPSCPTGAIKFVTREAAAYDEAAVEANLAERASKTAARAVEREHESKRHLTELEALSGIGDAARMADAHAASQRFAQEVSRDASSSALAAAAAQAATRAVAQRGCPGAQVRDAREAYAESSATGGEGGGAHQRAAAAAGAAAIPASELKTWPIQIKLAPAGAPFFAGCDLLVAADCTSFAYPTFHEKFLRGRVCLIGCPKLDGVDYSEKLTEIMAANDIRSVTVVRMSVPCCAGIEAATRKAIEASGKIIPLAVATISTDGTLA